MIQNQTELRLTTYGPTINCLVKAIQALSLTKTMAAITEVVRSAARELAGADGAAFVLREGDLCFYADEDAIAPLWKGRRFQMTTCVSGWAMIHRKAVVIPDIFKDSRVPIDAYRTTFVKSLVMVPIRTESPIGAIGIYWATQVQPSSEVVEALQMLANATSIAVENAHVYENLECRITEQTEQLRRKDLQIEQQRRLEAVGRLAGGVAHDFNNILTGILGSTEILTSLVGSDAEKQEELKQIQTASERAMALTRQLLAFSRRQTIAPKPLNLNTVVGEVTMMLKRLIGEDIKLMTSFDSELNIVEADRAQIEQVLLNLVVNARDALPGGGMIAIETHNRTMDDSMGERLGAAPGAYVMLSVTDTGIGMTPDICDQIFEPFFTTKKEGKGTGLGLATVYGVVKQNRGAVSVYSELGRGTSFKIWLPVSEQVKAIRAELKPDGTQAILPRGTETILIAEDEALVSNYAARVLRSLGYTVIVATNGRHATQLFQHDRERIALLLTDVIMPEMNGRELADTISAESKKTRFLFMSGYPADVIAQQGVLDGDVTLLEKPFNSRQLAEKVREVLDQPQAA